MIIILDATSTKTRNNIAGFVWFQKPKFLDLSPNFHFARSYLRRTSSIIYMKYDYKEVLQTDADFQLLITFVKDSSLYFLCNFLIQVRSLLTH